MNRISKKLYAIAILLFLVSCLLPHGTYAASQYYWGALFTVLTFGLWMYILVTEGSGPNLLKFVATEAKKCNNVVTSTGKAFGDPCSGPAVTIMPRFPARRHPFENLFMVNFMQDPNNPENALVIVMGPWNQAERWKKIMTIIEADTKEPYTVGYFLAKSLTKEKIKDVIAIIVAEPDQ